MTVNSREKRARRARRCGAAPRRCWWPPAAAAASRRRRFHASRVIAFGDESSLIVDTRSDANGSKYSVNATVSATDQTVVCGAQSDLDPERRRVLRPGLPGVQPGPQRGRRAGQPHPRGARRARRRPGAQIDAQQADSPLGAGDLVTRAGRRERRARRSTASTRRSSEDPARSPTSRPPAPSVGRQVNRLTDTGAKVLISTILDIGFTPFATRRARGARRHRPRGAAERS